MTVGGYNNSFHKGANENDGSIQWIRLRPAHYHFVFPTGVSIIGDVAKDKGITVAWGQKHLGVTIVDSGTTYTYFPRPLYNALLDEISSFCSTRDGCAAKKSDVENDEGSECWQVFDMKLGPVKFPTIRLHFDQDTRVNWYPSEYLQQRDDSGIWCSTFLENNVFQTVLGISFMLRHDFIFDLDQQRLGVADAACPEHQKPPSSIEASSTGPVHVPSKLQPHRLYSVDGVMAASLGYDTSGEAEVPPVVITEWSSAPVASRIPREALATAGALSLLVSAALLVCVHMRYGRRRPPAPRLEERMVPSAGSPDTSGDSDSAAETDGADGYLGVEVLQR